MKTNILWIEDDTFQQRDVSVWFNVSTEGLTMEDDYIEERLPNGAVISIRYVRRARRARRLLEEDGRLFHGLVTDVTLKMGRGKTEDGVEEVLQMRKDGVLPPHLPVFICSSKTRAMWLQDHAGVDAEEVAFIGGWHRRPDDARQCDEFREQVFEALGIPREGL